jgi:hypothetical protein
VPTCDRATRGLSAAQRRARLISMKAILQATLAAVLSGILVGALLKKRLA